MKPTSLASDFMATCLRRLRRGVSMDPRVLVSRDTAIEAPVRLEKNTRLVHCSLGRGTYIAGSCRLDRVKIGRFCSIGAELLVATGDHPTSGFASTHPAFFSDARQAGFAFADRTIIPERRLTASGWSAEVGNDVWIGHRVILLGGVSIGTGAVVGAGAVVTRDLDPYGIFAGVPARQVGRRCTEREATELLASEWWERDLWWLRDNWQAFNSIPAVLKALRRTTR